MSSIKKTRPRFTKAEAKRVAEECFGARPHQIEELPSERDQNFHLTEVSGRELVLKIASADDEASILDFQNQAMARIASRDPTLGIPRLIPSRSGDAMSELETEGATYRVRLFDFLPGQTMAKTRPRSPRLLANLGEFMGRLDVALEGFTHQAMDRFIHWDLRHAARLVRDALPGLEMLEAEERRLLERFLEAHGEVLAPRMEQLPTGVIHNDANDHNVLVSEDGVTIARILDFGDMVRTPLVFELANAAAYAMLDEPRPLEVAAMVAAGYHRARPLEEVELEVLFHAIWSRLALSVSHSARQFRGEPDKDYLRVSEAPAWKLLQKLDSATASLAHYRFRHACGLEPHPRGRALRRWLSAEGPRAANLLPFDLDTEDCIVFDLSVGSLELGGLEIVEDAEAFTHLLFDRMKRSGVAVGVGRYDEARGIYLSELFDTEEGAIRTVHIGVDLFVDAGSTIATPIDGKVHSFAENHRRLDYGPTIILEHQTDEGDRFYSLYGHLSRDSLEGLSIGKAFAKGETLGTVGPYPVNGDWPPHLHFQLMFDMLGMEGDFPGVVEADDRLLWTGLCPDPNLLVGIPENALKAIPSPLDDAPLIEKRRESLSEALSLAYHRPLQIVRGRGVYLYDLEGRPYLDMVNNVCHVGHCHPRVVQAAREQIAVLNTNTRYLHRNLVDYAERLKSTLPDSLEVCFFVNSGSEANELALRLATTHTGRRSILVLDGAYHGNSSSLVAISPYKFNGPGGGGAPAHVRVLPMPDGYRGEHRRDQTSYAERYVDDVAAVLQREGSAPAAFIAEPIMSCGGQIVLPPGYLARVYQLVRAAGGVAIADEVQVGFGRVGSHFWGFEAEGALPDIVTMGKPIGNGHPLGAVVCTRAIAESFANGMEYFNTFGGNPVSCAVGRAVLETIEQERLQENARETGGFLQAGLQELQSRHPIIGDVRGRGLFLGFELVSDRERLTPAAAEASHLVKRLMDVGILNSTDGPLHNVVKLKPPLVFSRANAELYLSRLARLLQENRFNHE